MANTFFWIFLILFFSHHILETGLSLLNNSYTQKQKNKIPDYFKDKIDNNRYQRSIEYTLERSRFGLALRWIQVPLIWGILLLGGFSFLNDQLASVFESGTLTHSVAYCATVGLILMAARIPPSLYSNFVIEKRYGFNKMTLKTFVLDLIKSLLLGTALGIPLLYLVFWLYEVSGPSWWFWAFLAFFAFELFIAAIYPTLLAPLFNKFTPLPDGELKEKIMALAKKIGFQMSGIYTIDSSRRSSHSNAYFAGMGKFRRIVLFDTLQSQLTPAEILSVLGHEMGHNKRRHIQKQLILNSLLSLIGFWTLSLVIEWEPLYAAFRAGPSAPHKALILFSLFGRHFTFFLTPLFNYLSRKYEYEADRFSIDVVQDKESMASSLVKLSRENLSNLTPHPLYSFYHYSHPTTLERIQAMENLYNPHLHPPAHSKTSQ